MEMRRLAYFIMHPDAQCENAGGNNMKLEQSESIDFSFPHLVILEAV